MELEKHSITDYQTIAPDKKRRGRNRLRVIDPQSPAHLYLKRLSKTSKATMERALDAIAKHIGEADHNLAIKYMDDVPWCKIERQHVHDILSILQDNQISPATQALYLCAIKGVMEEAWLNKMIDPDQYHRIAKVKKPKGSRIPKGEAIDLQVIHKALDACNDESHSGARDKAILAILLGAGLRRTECATLILDNIKFSKHEVHVTGKGNKERIVHIEAEALKYINAWLEQRGEHPGPLFNPIRKNGNIAKKALSDTSIYQICTKRGIAVNADKLKPHNIRRTFGTEHDKAETSLTTISELLGHASIETTRGYIFDDKEHKKRQAAEAVSMFRSK
jgi:integrase/recombinase XerD